MPFIPAGKDVQELLKTAKSHINFALLYNKYVYVNGVDDNNKENKEGAYTACNPRGNTNQAIEFYKSCYDSMKSQTGTLLEKVHKRQRAFLAIMYQYYDILELKASTETRLITGIGQPHPSETSMVFDHNLGIPYIPASSIKGLLRFSNVVSLIKDNMIDVQEKKVINDEDISDIRYYYGAQKKRGCAIFLDAYPEKIPDLEIDIMNPHYGKYYQGSTPPADYLEPTPIKFLTVAKGTTFIFRALVPKDCTCKEKEMLKKEIINVYEYALTKEGLGAKTSLGYGRFFKDLKKTDPEKIVSEFKQQKEKEEEANLTEAARLCRQIVAYSKDDLNKVHEIYQRLKNDEFANSNDETQIARALMDYYKKANMWDKPRDKQVQRVDLIKQKLGIQ